MLTFSPGVNLGSVSLLPSACQVRILVYPGSSKLWPFAVKISVPISNLTVVLRYLQSCANYEVRIIFNVLTSLRSKQLETRQAENTHSGDEVSSYVVVQPPRIPIELIPRSVLHWSDGRMIACVMSLLRSVNPNRQNTAHLISPVGVALLLL